MKKCIVAAALSATLFSQKYYDPKTCLEGSPSHASVGHREHQGVGYNTGYTTVAGFLTPNWTRPFQPFLDLRGHIFNDGHFAANAGVGGRYSINDYWSVGANVYYDFRDLTKFNGNQIGPGMEILSKWADFRLNGYIPVGGSDFLYEPKFKDFKMNNAFFTHRAEVALPNIQAEVGAPWNGAFGGMDFYFAGGSYYLFRRRLGGFNFGNAWGGMARIAAKVYDGIDLGIDQFYDRIFHYNIQGYINFSYPLGPNTIRKTGSRWNRWYQRPECNRDAINLARNTQPVQRFEIIPVEEKKQTRVLIDPLTGLPAFFVFVNNLFGSSGTAEDPFGNFAQAMANCQPFDIIYVYPGSGAAYDNGVELMDFNRLIASSSTFQMNGLTIPPRTVGTPCITNSSLAYLNGAGVVLANNCQVHGFVIQNCAGPGITDTTSTHSFLINNVFVQDNDGPGISCVNQSNLPYVTPVGSAPGNKIIDSSTINFNNKVLPVGSPEIEILSFNDLSSVIINHTGIFPNSNNDGIHIDIQKGNLIKILNNIIGVNPGTPVDTAIQIEPITNTPTAIIAQSASLATSPYKLKPIPIVSLPPYNVFIQKGNQINYANIGISLDESYFPGLSPHATSAIIENTIFNNCTTNMKLTNTQLLPSATDPSVFVYSKNNTNISSSTNTHINMTSTGPTTSALLVYTDNLNSSNIILDADSTGPDDQFIADIFYTTGIFQLIGVASTSSGQSTLCVEAAANKITDASQFFSQPPAGLVAIGTPTGTGRGYVESNGGTARLFLNGNFQLVPPSSCALPYITLENP